MNRLEKPKEFLNRMRLTDSDYQDNGMINHIADLLERYSTEQLNLYVVGSSKPENKTITFEVEELSETNPHRNDALIIVDKDGNYYQTVEDKTIS